MSMAGLRWARSVRGITGTQKLVLWALADMANDYGDAWPTAIALAGDCCLSERAVREAFDALESVGLIAGERALGRATRWSLQIGATPARQTAPPARDTVGSARRSAPPAHGSTPEGGSDPTPEPAADPPRNVAHQPRNHVPTEPSLTPIEPISTSPKESLTPHTSPGGDALVLDLIAPAGPAPDLLAEAVDAWNGICGSSGLSRVKALTPKRRKALKHILADQFGNNLDRWRAYCRTITKTPFCSGEGERGWRANIDWASREDSVVRMREGVYRGKSEAV